MERAACPAAAPVRAGVERTGEYARLFRGRRLGLIAGAASITAGYRSSIDALREEWDVRVLLAPEHGIRGMLGPGEAVQTQVDAPSGLPVYSLFDGQGLAPAAANEALQPPPQAMQSVDALVFDMQDAGIRYFTYASTLLCVMRACARAQLPLIVLDRPDPIGGLALEGNCHDPALYSFIGMAPVPIRHGMTLGELALYYNGELDVGCPLQVVPMDGWRRRMLYADTGLPFVPPSPNLPSQEALAVYGGTCLLAGTNVSEGRGTTTPFTLIGAPFIQPAPLVRSMEALGLPGVRFSEAYFCPSWGKYAHEACTGVRLHVTDPHALQPVALGVWLLDTLRRLWPQQFRFAPPPAGQRWHIDLASGSSALREGVPPAALLREWAAQAAAFAPLHERYRLYPD